MKTDLPCFDLFCGVVSCLVYSIYSDTNVSMIGTKWKEKMTLETFYPFFLFIKNGLKLFWPFQH
jgi:hypothetical protein